MDQDVKPMVKCCVGCLQDGARVHIEDEVNGDVIKVYKSLVIDEVIFWFFFLEYFLMILSYR